MKASSFPSGETSKSAPPPTEKAGESKSPGVRSTSGAFASARSIRRTCVRLPSSHVSQRLTKRESARTAFIFPFSIASSFFLLQSRSAAQAGQTSATRKRRLPSGEKRNAPTPPGRSVFFSGSPPATGRNQTCGVPERVERNASVAPSGEKEGLESRLSRTVRARAFFPSASTRQRFVQRLTAGRSVVVTV